MLDHESARRKAEEYVAKIKDYDLAIDDTQTIEHERYFVFFYNTREFLETRSILYALGGNGPIVVNRATGDVTILLTSKSVDESLREYETALSSDESRGSRPGTSG